MVTGNTAHARAELLLGQSLRASEGDTAVPSNLFETLARLLAAFMMRSSWFGVVLTAM